MQYTKGINNMTKKSDENLIFYVSDMEELPSKGHFRKMDAGREIALHIANGLANSRLIKYTDYECEFIRANSVGIVFPTHMWGVSLAVYTFLKHLRISKDTYVYAVVVGENLSACVDATLTKRMNSIDRFKRIFMYRGFGNEKDIFVRCIDFERDYDTTEESIRGVKNDVVKLGHILEGLLFHSIEELNLEQSKIRLEESMKKERRLAIPETVLIKPREEKVSSLRLSNVYLDDSILSGVKLCQVM